MKIVIQRNRWMSVDGEVKRIDFTGLQWPQILEAATFDTELGEGMFQYVDSATVTAQVRDLQAEKAENDRLLANNLPPLEEPIYKTVTIQRPPGVTSDYSKFEPFVQRWNETQPPVPEPLPVPDPRVVQIEQAARNASYGEVAPATVAELKAMTRDEYVAWFNANFTTAPQAIRLLRLLTLLIIRRLL